MTNEQIRAILVTINEWCPMDDEERHDNQQFIDDPQLIKDERVNLITYLNEYYPEFTKE